MIFMNLEAWSSLLQSPVSSISQHMEKWIKRVDDLVVQWLVVGKTPSQIVFVKWDTFFKMPIERFANHQKVPRSSVSACGSCFCLEVHCKLGSKLPPIYIQVIFTCHHKTTLATPVLDLLPSSKLDGVPVDQTTSLGEKHPFQTKAWNLKITPK